MCCTAHATWSDHRVRKTSAITTVPAVPTTARAPDAPAPMHMLMSSPLQPTVVRHESFSYALTLVRPFTASRYIPMHQPQPPSALQRTRAWAPNRLRWQGRRGTAHAFKAPTRLNASRQMLHQLLRAALRTLLDINSYTAWSPTPRARWKIKDVCTSAPQAHPTGWLSPLVNLGTEEIKTSQDYSSQSQPSTAPAFKPPTRLNTSRCSTSSACACRSSSSRCRTRA